MPLPSTSPGTVKVATLSRSTGSAPKRKNGRNLPHRVIVRSTSRPAKMSAKPSQIRMTRNRVPAAAALIPTTSV